MPDKPPRAFRQRDLDAAVRAARRAGQQIAHAEIDHRGHIVIIVKGLPTHGPCVYFVEASPKSPVKIGFTRGLISGRIKALQTGSPAPLRLIAVAPAEPKAEGAIHRHLKGERVTGEWFRRSRRLRLLIEGVRRGDSIQELLANG